LLFELLTGKRPFIGNEKETESGGYTAHERVRYAHLHVEPPDPRTINPGINQKLADTVLRALEKDPKRRYQGCQEMVTALFSALVDR